MWDFLVSIVGSIRAPEEQMTWEAQIRLIKVLLGVGRYLDQVQTSLGQVMLGGVLGGQKSRGVGGHESWERTRRGLLVRGFWRGRTTDAMLGSRGFL